MKYSIGLKERLLTEFDSAFSSAVDNAALSNFVVISFFLITWKLFSLPEAGCFLLIIALLTNLAEQNLQCIKERFRYFQTYMPQQLRDSDVDLLPNESREEGLNRKYGMDWEQKTIDDMKNAEDRIEKERSALWRWEISVALIGTFLWGFGERLEKVIG